MGTAKELAQKLVQDKTFGYALTNLYNRWQDEKMYEDWKDYEKTMAHLLTTRGGIENPQNVKGTKRPFGVKFDNDGYTIHIYVKIQGEYFVVGGNITKITKN